MITTVTNYGDNFGVRFPKSVWETVQIFENDKVEIFIKGNAIMIERQEKTEHLTTKERIASFFSKAEETINNSEHNQLPEIEWGRPIGKEVW